ncbi:MAG: hypothetical protein ABI488_00120, partial [Polyangiaceae bacterium]
MNNRSRTPASDPHISAPLNDEESRVRVSERVPSVPPATRKSAPPFSLAERLETKLAEAAALLAKLEPQDARSRL